MKEILKNIIEDDANTLSFISDDELLEASKVITNKKRIFVCGAGRSLLMIKAFAMRLVHMGFTAYVVGDTTTPAITSDDILIIASGSGETSTLKIYAEKAKKIGAYVFLFTTAPNSSIAKLADSILVIPASVNHLNKNGKSWQPGGNSFEQCLLLVGDAVIISVAQLKNIDINGSLPLHANLE